ncbi:MAG: hypothetical protein H6Q17_1993 [Bacteroidetes bacterium]|nr:hypothetical protein [Bacteroidota bacterium]
MNMNSNFDQENPFTVPDGYFEDFAAKMASMTQMSMPSMPWYRKPKLWIAIAAAVSGVIIGTRLLMPTEISTQVAAMQPTVEESYILNQIDESNLVSYSYNAEEAATSAE